MGAGLEGHGDRSGGSDGSRVARFPASCLPSSVPSTAVFRWTIFLGGRAIATNRLGHALFVALLQPASIPAPLLHPLSHSLHTVIEIVPNLIDPEPHDIPPQLQ